VTFTAKFAKGKKVFVVVTSEKETDVDLFVEDANGEEVAVDDRVSKDCLVAFVPKADGDYKIKVVNLGQGDNKGVVTYGVNLFKLTELKPFDIKEDETKVFELDFTKDAPAAVFIDSEKMADVDVIVKDKNGNEITADDSVSPNCAVSWTPAYTGTFRILVTNLGQGDNRCKLSHTGAEAKKQKRDDL
jgi:hypothetical protein